MGIHLWSFPQTGQDQRPARCMWILRRVSLWWRSWGRWSGTPSRPPSGQPRRAAWMPVCRNTDGRLLLSLSAHAARCGVAHPWAVLLYSRCIRLPSPSRTFWNEDGLLCGLLRVWNRWLWPEIRQSRRQGGWVMMSTPCDRPAYINGNLRDMLCLVWQYDISGFVGSVKCLGHTGAYNVHLSRVQVQERVREREKKSKKNRQPLY